MLKSFAFFSIALLGFALVGGAALANNVSVSAPDIGAVDDNVPLSTKPSKHTQGNHLYHTVSGVEAKIDCLIWPKAPECIAVGFAGDAPTKRTDNSGDVAVPNNSSSASRDQDIGVQFSNSTASEVVRNDQDAIVPEVVYHFEDSIGPYIVPNDQDDIAPEVVYHFDDSITPDTAPDEEDAIAP
jgi:hypothetical protein